MPKSLKYSLPLFLISALMILTLVFSTNIKEQEISERAQDKQSFEPNVMVTARRVVWRVKKIGFGIKTKVPVVERIRGKLPLRFFDVNVTYDKFSSMWVNKPVALRLSMIPENFMTPDSLRQKGYEKAPNLKPESDTISIRALGSAELKISPDKPIVHRVSKLGTSIFQWNIEPLTETKSAKVTLSASVHLDEGPPFPLKPYEMTFAVRSSALHSITTWIQAINPVWTFLLAFIPAMWGLFVFFKNREA